MNNTDDLGKLILRLTLGILILLHGINKVFNGVGGAEGMLASHGLPAFVAYGAYVGEVLAPILLILGIYARVGGVLVVINMLFALFLAHMGQFGTITKTGGWALELQAFFLFTGLAIAFLGAGRYSIGGKTGKFN
ncbi:DoxX family protein [Pigmentiphaga litoralis]|uniref:Putative oxidoreductase n=1 Tax=Pigmentiphaga litoralis TaxID=516702 RepID=A0A7Y9IZI6_9BURK|nr:DoxX family protein [Pigmentiphaga litoralis]NYE26622.1 putative oxidoreductase [Pigmentiphaga litoralis]NYE85968.1 putative oxidoreductase [Pigmentiphaga litoralis]